MLRRGHDGEAEAMLGAGGGAFEAADAVGMPHEIRVRYINIHGAFAGALTALTTELCFTTNTEDTQHTEQPHASATRAEIIAEGAVGK